MLGGLSELTGDSGGLPQCNAARADPFHTTCLQPIKQTFFLLDVKIGHKDKKARKKTVYMLLEIFHTFVCA